jgi:aryl-alcohol dehydrogenase-like predicted oxidoreductase
MEYRKLGNTGIAVSNLALGTMHLSRETSEEEMFALLDALVEAGGDLIDTAGVYTGSAHADRTRAGRLPIQRSEGI